MLARQYVGFISSSNGSLLYSAFHDLDCLRNFQCLAPQEMDVRQRRGLTGSPSDSVSPQSDMGNNKGYGVRSYGFSRRGIRGNFIPPIRSNGNNMGNITKSIAGKGEDALDDSTKRWYLLS